MNIDAESNNSREIEAGSMEETINSSPHILYL